MIEGKLVKLTAVDKENAETFRRWFNDPDTNRWLARGHVPLTIEDEQRLLEEVDGSDTDYLLHDLRRLRAFADRYDLPLTFDTAHAGTSPYELLDAYEFVQGRVVNLHFSDLAHRHVLPKWKWVQTFWQNHQIPGQGELPLAEFMRVLLRGGYCGILTVEVSPTALQAWSLSRIRRGLARTVAVVRQLEAQASRSDL